MVKPRARKRLFSLAPVEFRNSPIAGRGVFARKRFEPGEVVVPYAPKQRRIDASDPEAEEAQRTKLTLLSERHFVIIPDTSVPGGWLCNHSCRPNSDLYSDREGRIQCARPISPGAEVTIFYGWVTQNQPGRDPCRCGAPGCLGFINFDLRDADAEHWEADTEAGEAFRARLSAYEAFLRSIGQEQVLATIAANLSEMRTRRASPGAG